jgi:hypothetical protein
MNEKLCLAHASKNVTGPKIKIHHTKMSPPINENALQLYSFFLDKVKMYIKGGKRKFCTNITAILCNFYIIYLYNLRAILT